MSYDIATMNFAEKLNRLINSPGLSNKSLAARLGSMVSSGTINNWRQGTILPRIDEARALCELFKVSIEYLVYDELEDDSKKESELTADQAKILGAVEALGITYDHLAVFFTIIRKQNEAANEAMRKYMSAMFQRPGETPEQWAERWRTSRRDYADFLRAARARRDGFDTFVPSIRFLRSVWDSGESSPHPRTRRLPPG